MKLSITMRDTSGAVAVSAAQLKAACQSILFQAGTPNDVAEKVVHHLVANEADGVPSHGVMRIFDYVEDIHSGYLDPTARPVVSSPCPQVRVIDGQGGFGALAATEIATNLLDLLNDHPLCAVAIENTGHLGRLADIGHSIADRDGAVLGFVNYLGGGQRVIPWGGRDGRLCTNPILIAIPGEPTPFVLDISTSTVSEGSIRHRWLAGLSVPSGWLVDAEGEEVHDPGRLYTDPPTAFMTPLGGGHGYKGFGLAIAVELLAGIVTGSGFVQPNVVRRGNGGLFIGLSPTLAGRSYQSIIKDAAMLREHVTASSNSVHWPGSRVRNAGLPDALHVDRWVWQQLLETNGEKTSDENSG